MCRLLVLRAKPNNKINEFIDALVKASENDVILEKLTSGRRKSHRDGWGVSAIGIADYTLSLLYHRSLLPIFHEQSKYLLNIFKEHIQRYSEIYLLLHSRASSKREPYGEKYVHPFMVEKETFTLWFIHNGSVEKRELASKLDISPWIHSDSEILSYYISRELDKCIDKQADIDNCVVEIYRDIYKYTTRKSALNTGLMILWKNHIHLYLTYYTWETRESEKEYYQIYSYRGEEVIGAFSSTLKYHIKDKVTPIEQGLYKFEVDKLEKIYDFK
ncbi:MAG: hypothetical protein B6U89_04825 [Desulfurococcales archaeon ex4484_58]|nr:MAG: hypothetical protein B6U89_04825 [Desulfurococcales archaeon ex4484_58]